jgi:hypothetical protein
LAFSPRFGILCQEKSGNPALGDEIKHRPLALQSLHQSLPTYKRLHRRVVHANSKLRRNHVIMSSCEFTDSQNVEIQIVDLIMWTSPIGLSNLT